MIGISLCLLEVLGSPPLKKNKFSLGEIMKIYNKISLIVFVFILFLPTVSAGKNVIIDFVDTNTGKSPDNLNLEIVSENGDSWNITEFPKEIELEPGNYSVVGTINLFGKKIILDSLNLQKIELQKFEVGSDRENYTITNDDYSNYGLTVIGEYKLVNNTEMYTTYVTFEVGPIQYVAYAIYGVIGLTTLGLMTSLANGVKKIKKKGKSGKKKMEEKGFEFEPEIDVEYDPKLIDLKYEVDVQNTNSNIIDFDGFIKVSDANKEMMKRNMEYCDIRISDDDGNLRIILNSYYNSVLKKVKATNKIKSATELVEINEKMEWFKFLIKLILLIFILLFGISGFLPDVDFGINDLLIELERLL